MRHVENAYNKLEKKMDADGSIMGILNFIKIENKEDIKGVAPIVSFTIQSDPIGEVGINGCQALDMLKYVACLFESLNDAFPSIYNEGSLKYIEAAITEQNLRTADRIARSVEGQNKA